MNCQVIDSNICHAAASVPEAECPLSPVAFSVFNDGLKLVVNAGDIPAGYGARTEELGSDGWDEYEHIVIGSSGRTYPIELPTRIWAPRMRLWAQALYVLNSIQSSMS